LSLQRSISVTGLTRKTFLVGVVLSFAVLTFFTAKWVLGNAISSRTEFTEATEFAVGLAPDDPQTRFAHAVLLSRTFDPADEAASLRQLETATSLSMHNYLLWIDLGKSLERNGEPEKSVAAFRRALALAPNYSLTKWTLGNSLLRSGEQDEAIPLIIAAAESDANYAAPAASLMWQLNDGDLAVLLKDAPLTKSRLIPILGREKKFDEALAIWNSFDQAQKLVAFPELGQAFYAQLAAEKRHRDALRVLSEISVGPMKNHSVGNIFDGGFESRTPLENRSVFEWRYAADPRMGLTEGQKRSGNYAFLIGLPSGTKAIKSLAQTIAVEPGRNYVFEVYFRSDLKTNGAVKWEIVNLADGKRIAVTDALTVSNEWIGLRASFTAPSDSDGVEIRLIKECTIGDCPIEGNIWFDDVSVART
jgi:hypothetical protein